MDAVDRAILTVLENDGRISNADLAARVGLSPSPCLRRVQRPEVTYCHHVTGNYDYVLQIEVADLPAYEEFHANQLAALPAVATVTSYVTMKTLTAERSTSRP